MVEMSKEFSISSLFEPMDIFTLRTIWWPKLHSTNHQPQFSSIHSMRFLLCHQWVNPKFHWLRQIATTLRQFHWHLFSIGHCAWFYERGKRGSYLVLAIAPFWLRIESKPKIVSWRSQWNLGYTRQSKYYWFWILFLKTEKMFSVSFKCFLGKNIFSKCCKLKTRPLRKLMSNLFLLLHR